MMLPNEKFPGLLQALTDHTGPGYKYEVLRLCGIVTLVSDGHEVDTVSFLLEEGDLVYFIPDVTPGFDLVAIRPNCECANNTRIAPYTGVVPTGQLLLEVVDAASVPGLMKTVH